jgi:predicted esterase YcpF (UPF0227 family)
MVAHILLNNTNQTTMMNILYIHGYNGSPYGNTYALFDGIIDKTSTTLHTIDYDPTQPIVAIESIKQYIKDNNINLIIGSSLGGFLTMHLYGYSRIVINPCWDPATELPLIDYTGPTEEYERLRHSLVEELDNEERHLCSGCFAPLDELLCTKYLEIFQQFFNRTYIIPGGHQVSAEAVVKIVNEIIPDHEYQATEYTRQLVGMDNAPWFDKL